MKIPVVRLWPVISIVLCSCALKAPSPPPVVLAPAHCPAPLEGDANLEALLHRDAVMRRYIGGLRAALDCWEAQTDSGGTHGNPD